MICRVAIPSLIQFCHARPVLAALCAWLFLAPGGPALAQPAGRIVQVDGRGVFLHCVGEGAPTVLLEAGASQGSLSWAWVQEYVARVTRVCSYDRPGYGASDPVPGPMDAANTSRALRSALAAADINGPYIAVGQSLGGPYARMFAFAYKADVVGLVLLDATHPSMLTNSAEIGMEHAFDAPSAFAQDVVAVLASTGLMRLAIEAGFFSRMNDRWKDLPPAAAEAMKPFLASPKRWETFFKETRSVPETLAQVGALPPLGGMPVTVVAAGTWGANADAPTAAKYMEFSHRQQRKWLAISTNSRFLIIPEADHLSLLSNPDHAAKVASVIAEMVAAWRRDHKFAPRRTPTSHARGLRG